MSEHYYSQSPASAHDRQHVSIIIAGKPMTVTTDAGVFSKGGLDTGTSLLLRALPDVFAGRALDLGCGWGPVGIHMAFKWPDAQIVMADINERAVMLARENLAANSLAATVLQSDGLAAVDGPISLIATNPPIRAGKAVVYRLFEESVARLSPNGSLFVVMRKQQGADSAEKKLKTLCSKVDIVARSNGFRVFHCVV